MKIPIRVEEHVTWKALLFLLASFALFQLLALNSTVAKAESVALSVRTETRAAIAELERKVEMNKMLSDAGITEVRKDIQALYNYQLTKQRQDRLEKPK